jgi:hypothetical protein
VLVAHPELQECVVNCVQCGIRFLAHPRNAGRRNLRCPFGCRQHHRRQRSYQRSAAYYRTAEGRRRKKRLNAHRQYPQVPATAPPADLASPPELGQQASSAGECGAAEVRPGDLVLDESRLGHSPMVPYVRMIVNLIEGFEFTCREVVHRLRRALRQHSIGARGGTGYLRGFLHEHPP